MKLPPEEKGVQVSLVSSQEESPSSGEDDEEMDEDSSEGINVDNDDDVRIDDVLQELINKDSGEPKVQRVDVTDAGWNTSVTEIYA